MPVIGAALSNCWQNRMKAIGLRNHRTGTTRFYLMQPLFRQLREYNREKLLRSLLQFFSTQRDDCRRGAESTQQRASSWIRLWRTVYWWTLNRHRERHGVLIFLGCKPLSALNTLHHSWQNDQPEPNRDYSFRESEHWLFSGNYAWHHAPRRLRPLPFSEQYTILTNQAVGTLSKNRHKTALFYLYVFYEHARPLLHKL